MKINKNSEEVITNKVLNLMLWYQIEDSNAWLRVMESQVKFLEERKKQLFDDLDYKKEKINNLSFSIYFYCLNLLKFIVFNLINW